MLALADTSDWVDHLRRCNHHLATLLRDARVLMHPLVLGELACANLRNRQDLLSWLGQLPFAKPAGDAEALHLVETRRLGGLGIGWVDAHLIASALLTRCPLWTLDRRLRRAAHLSGVAAAAV